MTVNIAINGFGRIGRNVLRALYEAGKHDIKIVGINDLTDIDMTRHLLKYDSVHGIFGGDVKVEGNNLIVNGDSIRITAEKDPKNLPWKELGVDIVFECTGIFKSKETAGAHLEAGAKKVG
jgi:glyceraldehyde 3-phosphate dehydrogenase